MKQLPNMRPSAALKASNAARNLIGITAVALIAALGIVLAPAHLAAHTLAAGHSISLGAVAFGGLIVNRANLDTLFTGFKANFQDGLGLVTPQWSRVATPVPSTTSIEKYAWLGQFPRIREWLGDRVINAVASHDYTIKNKDYEATISVDRNDINDDQYGVYAPLFKELGRATAAFPDELIWPFLAAGFANPCYDGQNFFSTAHPVLDANGNPQNAANTDGGAGQAWFLFDSNRALLPILYQKRQDFALVRKDQPSDDNVFMQKKFVYGVDGRANVGYGFWQFIWGSKQALDAAHYQTAYQGLVGMQGDYGRPLGLMPNVLVVGKSNLAAGRQIVKAERNADGSSNIWYQTADLLVVPWLP